MIQGTASNTGKSLITAGLCRIFNQDGYTVSPFKSQNMALNSFITNEGLEMGRAQVMQAEAAGVEPSVRMNPILLKPTSDRGSQVIVNGVPRGVMEASEYYKYKNELVPEIMKAYSSLVAESDIIVIEGAGSPAEINLKDNDIVNMGMAKMAGAPVLLTGDIDRGGVFASLYGTIKLLDIDEQDMIKGFIINKFRGDPEILRPGLKPLEDMTGVEVLGVIPMLDIDVDDEDSITQRFKQRKARAPIDIAVIRLPRISNFTDFYPLERMEEVSLRYITSVEELGRPDLIILPGTKNTMGDLGWLRETGLYTSILGHASSGCAIVGICGGYQMLGSKIADPQNVESGGTATGFGLLPCNTVFLGEKTRARVTGTFKNASGIFEKMAGVPFQGYEIHMGITEAGGIPLLEAAEENKAGKPDGLFSGNIFGCYIHGLFDNPDCANSLINCLRESKGLDPIACAVNWSDYKQSQYDRLADALRESIDIEKIYKIISRGV